MKVHPFLSLLLLVPAWSGPAFSQCQAKAVDYGKGSNTVFPNGPVPLPKYEKTYTSSRTRGFYFQAPTRFLAIGLQVPDEQKVGYQHVALYRFKNEPPAYPKTTPGVPLFYKEKVPSNQIIRLVPPVIFNKGDWVVVIGACSGTSTSRLYNSYGPRGPFSSTLLGKPVTLFRCGMQANLVATKGKYNIWSEKKYNVCRIRLFVAGQPGLPPSLTTTAKPVLGTTAALKLTPANPGAQAGLVVLGVGRANVPLPMGTLLVKPPFFLSFLTPGAGGTIQLPIPKDNALLCAGPLDFQGFLIFSAGVTMTNGTEWFLGR